MKRICLLAIVFLFAIARPAAAENWPQWRGPQGDGTSRETGLPIAWSEDSGIEWKCKLPEWGTSTPIVWDDAVFVTSHANNRELVLLKINKQTGRIEWTRQVGTESITPVKQLSKRREMRRRQEFHWIHNLATPSPVTDGEVVVVHFGSGELAAYDFQGRQLWHRNLQEEHGNYTVWWGHSNSPVLYEDLVISVCMQDSCHDLSDELAPSYLVAHDKLSGKQRWKTMRMTGATGEHCDSYTTPVFRTHRGRLEMIVMGGEVLDAYDPATGKQWWQLPGLVSNRAIPSPVAAGEMIYATLGLRRALVAVKPGGDGRRTRDDIVWKYDQGISDSPSPVVAGELLFTVSIDGIVRCLDAHSGRLKWKDRLKGHYYASPITAEARVYFLNMEGLTTVVSASSRYDKLTENQLDDSTIASPVAGGGKIFIRGRKWLYCLTK